MYVFRNWVFDTNLISFHLILCFVYQRLDKLRVNLEFGIGISEELAASSNSKSKSTFPTFFPFCFCRNLNSLRYSFRQKREGSSVTRFGEISTLWQHFTSLWQIFDSLFLIWQNVEPILTNLVHYWANFHHCFWPIIEKSGHAEWKMNNKLDAKNWKMLECRHSTVDSSAPSILLPRVWVPSTLSMPLSIHIDFLSRGKDEK